MPIQYADDVGQFYLFSSESYKPFGDKFRLAAKTIAENKGGVFGKKDLIALIKTYETEFDWHSSKAEPFMRKHFTPAEMPKKMSKPDTKPVKSRPVSASKPKPPPGGSAKSPGPVRPPAGGAGAGFAPAGGAGAVFAPAGGAGAAPAPAGGAGAAPDDTVTAASREHLLVLAPGAHVMAMIADNEREVLYLAVPPADYQFAKNRLGDTAVEYEQVCQSMKVDDDQGPDKVEDADIEFIKGVFKEQKKYGYKNYMKSLVAEKPTPTIRDFPDDLDDYITTKEVVKARFDAAINQYDDIGGHEDKVHLLKEIRNKFMDCREIKSVFQHIEDERKRQEEERKQRELQLKKQGFLNSFNDKTTAEEIKARHEVFLELKKGLVFTDREYLDLVREQSKSLMEQAGVIQQGYSIIMLSREEMQAKLEPFKAIDPLFTDMVIGAYLNSRDECIELGMKAGDFEFNQKFEAERQGETLKTYIESSTTPNIWTRFAKDYELYLATKKFKEEHAELLRKLEEATSKKRPHSPSPSGSPKGAGAALPSGDDEEEPEDAGEESEDHATDNRRSSSRVRKAPVRLNPRAVSQRGSPTHGRSRRASPTPRNGDPAESDPDA